MRLKRINSLLSAAVACGGLVVAALPLTVAAQLTGGLNLTSDYVWRGSSQTRGNPAIQGLAKLAHESGLYTSVWGSNVKFKPDNGANSEFDIALGWNGKVAQDWALDVYFLRYQYPGSDVGLNWNEVNAAVTWRDNYWVSLGHSSNAMASKTSGTYALIGARYPINEQWRMEATLARYFLDRDYADSYTHGSVGVVWAFKAPFEARLTLHSTDSAARQLFPGMAGSRAELSLQASF